MASNDEMFRLDYSAEPTKNLDYIPIPDHALAAIGRLIRACAEFEDCLDAFICNLAEISEAKQSIIFGRMPVSGKLLTVEKLAAIRADGAAGVASRLITHQLRAILKMRNVVAHGVYFGTCKDGGIHFKSADTLEDSGQHGSTVYSYHPDLINAHALVLEKSMPEIERELHIQAWRETRKKPVLRDHPKARKGSSSRKET